jgi:cytochrome c-type biogenesis protein CcmH
MARDTFAIDLNIAGAVMILRTNRFLLMAGLLLLLQIVPQVSQAVEPSEMLPNPMQEERAREISKGLRCVVCRNQSIDDSNAEIARDLRVLLRERIAAGDTDQEAVDYLVDRYGVYILLKPPLEITTYLLWVGPLLMLFAAFYGFRALWRRSSIGNPEYSELTEADKTLLASIIEEKD